jgi:integrase
MASVYRPKGSKKYVIMYFDEHDRRRKQTGTTDKAVTERIAHDIENKVALRRQGLIDPTAERFAEAERTPLAEHITAWRDNLIAEGRILPHVDEATGRLRRLVAIILGTTAAWLSPRRLPNSQRSEVPKTIASAIKPARLSHLTRTKVQAALAKLKESGASHQTCNHYRDVVTSFVRWCRKNDRLRDNPLEGLTSYNVQEDLRHDRRTVSLEELRRLIAATERGPVVNRVPGRVRALVYRLAVATGLRYSEIASITPESFDFAGKAPSVRVAAAYTKNGQTAVLPLPGDLVADLRAFVATRTPGTQVFPLPHKKGAVILRRDLKVAGIPYQDASGRFFDFHSLRCETATLADAAGVTPRVVQKLMRHSTLELTGRYTRPRAVDIETAAGMLPSLKPEEDRPEALAATGTDPGPSATAGATEAKANESNPDDGKGLASIGRKWLPPVRRNAGRRAARLRGHNSERYPPSPA